MSSKPQPDAALEALKRARKRAEDLAAFTGTAIVQWEDGKVVRSYPYRTSGPSALQESRNEHERGRPAPAVSQPETGAEGTLLPSTGKQSKSASRSSLVGGLSRTQTFARITVLAGTGVQVGSWAPVISALKHVGYSGVSCSDTANTVLAQIVQNRRLGYLEMPDGKPTPAKPQVDCEYTKVVAQIRTELRVAQNEGHIRLREDFQSTWDGVINRAAIPEETEIAVATTNWDDVVVREISARWPSIAPDARHSHLHGGLSEDGPDLLLPSESAIEPFRPQKSESAQELLRKRRELANVIEKADLVVLWGLGLSPLDAELMQAVLMGLYGPKSKVRRITIANPDHRKVARRLMALKPPQKAKSEQPELLGWIPGEVYEYDWPG